jgi:hypothetical protein
MDEDKATWDWGGAALPPSAQRINARGWLCASVVGGIAAGVGVLVLSWRPIPGVALPPETLGEHAVHWAALACHAASKYLCGGASAAYSDFWAHLAAPERHGLVYRCAAGVWAAMMPAILLAEPMLRPRDGAIHIRGPGRLCGKGAIGALVALLAAQVKRRPDHEIAPGIAYPAELWTRGTLIAGGVGSGKSTALRRLIDAIVKSREQMLLFDAKSELTSGWRGPAILAPWDQRSLAWDIAKDVRNVLEMERFAAAVVRESSDPLWSSASRQILVGAMLRLAGERGTDWGWTDLRDILSSPHPELLATMEDWHPVAARSLAKASVTSAGILINLSAFCAPIFHFADAWGAHSPERRVSLVEWTLGRSRHKQIILQGHGAYGEIARALAEGVVGVFASLVASVEMPDDPMRKIWFVADEVAQLGKVPMLPLFSMGRSRGVRCVVATQDLAQLEEIHGAPAVKALVSMVGTVIVGQTMQGESADLLCKAFGTREVERPGAAQPRHDGPGSFSRDEVPLYKPSELSSRLGLSKDGQSVKLILFTGGTAHELSWPIFHMREERPAHVLASWLKRAKGPVGADGKRLGRASEPPSDATLLERPREEHGSDAEAAMPESDASFADGLDADDGDNPTATGASPDVASDAWLFESVTVAAGSGASIASADKPAGASDSADRRPLLPTR